MKIEVVEVSSGFGNIPNTAMLIDNYNRSSRSSALGNAYDRVHCLELPEGFEVFEWEGESVILDKDANVWELYLETGKGISKNGVFSISNFKLGKCIYLKKANI